MNDSTAQLLMDIAGCSLVAEGLKGGHPCSDVVHVQKRGFGQARQVPESWDGHLESAPLLFVSSNPAISHAEVYPEATWAEVGSEPDPGSWPPDRLIAYFDGRFDDGPTHPGWIKDGVRTRLPDGSYSRSVSFLSAVRNRATEVYEGVIDRPVIPGADYCLTEVVHCKSAGERGVRAAAPTCADRFLGRVLACSPAPVIVALGEIAGAHLRAQPESGIATSTIHTVSEACLGGRQRLVAFLPHPNRRGEIKKLQALDANDRLRLRNALTEHSRS